MRAKEPNFKVLKVTEAVPRVQSYQLYESKINDTDVSTVFNRKRRKLGD